MHNAKDVRLAKVIKAETTTTNPRLGNYSVLLYGSNSNPLRLGHFQLSAGGKYGYFDNGGGLTGSGTYKHNGVKGGAMVKRFV